MAALPPGLVKCFSTSRNGRRMEVVLEEFPLALDEEWGKGSVAASGLGRELVPKEVFAPPD